MKRKIWLHIGAEKTGTTTIQVALAQNNDVLARQGILYPSTLGGPLKQKGGSNHIALTAYAMDDDKMEDELRIVCEVHKSGTLDRFREQLRGALLDEIKKANRPTIVLSNEHCSSRLRSPREIGRLKALCDEITDDVTVILYIRNPVDFIASLYSTTVTGGNTNLFPSPIPPRLMDKANYLEMINAWGAAFGNDKVVVRRFDSQHFVNGDLLDDFMDAVGAPGTELVKPERRNESLSLESLTFLREFNKHVPRIDDGKLNKLRGQIVEALRRLPSHTRFTISRNDADAVMAYFEADMQEIKTKYFPQSEGDLFAPSSSVSEKGTAVHEISFEETVKIAADIWKYARRRNIQLQKEKRP